MTETKPIEWDITAGKAWLRTYIFVEADRTVRTRDALPCDVFAAGYVPASDVTESRATIERLKTEVERLKTKNAERLEKPSNRIRPHINADGEFQSDKYPTCPPGKVPLSVKDPMAQDLLKEYARRRRSVDAEFSDDLESALKAAATCTRFDCSRNSDCPTHGKDRPGQGRTTTAAEALKRDGSWTDETRPTDEMLAAVMSQSKHVVTVEPHITIVRRGDAVFLLDNHDAELAEQRRLELNTLQGRLVNQTAMEKKLEIAVRDFNTACDERDAALGRARKLENPKTIAELVDCYTRAVSRIPKGARQSFVSALSVHPMMRDPILNRWAFDEELATRVSELETLAEKRRIETLDWIRKHELLAAQIHEIDTALRGESGTLFGDPHWTVVLEEARTARSKWRDYEDNYILPVFTWAKECGIDLEVAVREKSRPGSNCVVLFFEALRARLSELEALEAPEALWKRAQEQSRSKVLEFIGREMSGRQSFRGTLGFVCMTSYTPPDQTKS